MKFHFKRAELLKSFLANSLVKFGYERLPRQRKSCRRINRTLDNLLLSCIFTIVLYYAFIIFLYYQLSSKKLTDPSLSLFRPLASLCDSKDQLMVDAASGHSSAGLQHTFNHSDDLKLLLKMTKSLLAKAASDYEFFICYRSLFDLLRVQEPFQETNSFDMCVYDKNSAKWINKINFLRNLLENRLETELASLVARSSIKYEYQRFFGYYHLKYGSASLYLYLFVHSSPNKYEYDTIVRYGWLYSQFQYISKGMDQLGKLHTFSAKDTSVPSKLPFYMIEEMGYRVELNDGLSLPLPNDPYTMLMYSYPNDWWRSYQNCTI